MDYMLYTIAILYTVVCVFFFVYKRLADEVSKFDTPERFFNVHCYLPYHNL